MPTRRAARAAWPADRPIEVIVPYPPGQASAARWSGTPDVPTFRERGQDLISGATRGIVAPPALPAGMAETARMGLPLAPRIGADYRADVVALEPDLRGLWQRRPWRES